MPTTKDNPCKDCGKLCWSSSERCLSCHRQFDKERKAQAFIARREDNPEEYHCVDCGQLVWRREAKRCKTCANRIKTQDPVIQQVWRESMQDRWAAGEFDEMVTSLESRQRSSECMIRLWKEGRLDHCHGGEAAKKRGDSMRRRWKLGEMSRYFQSPTQPEKDIQWVLDVLGIGYIFNTFRLKSYLYDFYLPDFNTLIEYDGWYWHYSERAIANGTFERGKVKERTAQEAGYRLIRLKGQELRDLTRAEIQERLGELLIKE